MLAGMALQIFVSALLDLKDYVLLVAGFLWAGLVWFGTFSVSGCLMRSGHPSLVMQQITEG